jgi:hypothetical protein
MWLLIIKGVDLSSGSFKSGAEPLRGLFNAKLLKNLRVMIANSEYEAKPIDCYECCQQQRVGLIP